MNISGSPGANFASPQSALAPPHAGEERFAARLGTAPLQSEVAADSLSLEAGGESAVRISQFGTEMLNLFGAIGAETVESARAVNDTLRRDLDSFNQVATSCSQAATFDPEATLLSSRLAGSPGIGSQLSLSETYPAPGNPGNKQSVIDTLMWGLASGLADNTSAWRPTDPSEASRQKFRRFASMKRFQRRSLPLPEGENPVTYGAHLPALEDEI